MEETKRLAQQLTYDDEIPDPESTPPRDDEAEPVRAAAAHRRIPRDEDVPNDCFSEKLL